MPSVSEQAAIGTKDKEMMKVTEVAMVTDEASAGKDRTNETFTGTGTTIDSRDINCSDVFNIMYRTYHMQMLQADPENRLWTSLSKKELKMAFAQLSARCFYDEVQVMPRIKMKRYLELIIEENRFEETAEDLLHDLSMVLKLIVCKPKKCFFLNCDLRDYYAAMFFTNEEYHSKWNIKELLSKETDGKKISKYMYEIDSDFCHELVLNCLEEMYEKWLSGTEDDWKTFDKYLRKTYEDYACLSNHLRVYGHSNGNKIRTPLMELVHLVLYTLMPEESSDTKHTLSYSPDDKWPSDYNYEMCNRLTDFIHRYDDDPDLKVLGSSGYVPEVIEQTVPEWDAVYDDNGELLCESGPMVTVSSCTSTDGYELFIRTKWLGEIKPEKKGRSQEKETMCEDLRNLLMNEGIFLPCRDYQNLKVLRIILQKMVAEKSSSRSFGIMKNS